LFATIHADRVNALGLGTPTGFVDLTTGKWTPSDKDALVTMSTSVDPAEEADCPRWIQFMNEIPRGDEELARYVRLWIGYGASQLRFQEAHGSRLFRQGKPRALLEVKSPNIPTAIYEARLRGYDRAPPKRTLHRCGRSDSVCVCSLC
jgi:D5 N terminal like